MKQLVLLLTLFAFIPSATYAKQPVINPARSVIIEGPIMGGGTADLRDKITKMAQESNAPITILLNSPGGGVIEGRMFISAMKSAQAKGVELTCVVKDVAASMAFQILLHCNKRFALTNSWLLWHRVRVGIREPLTAPLAADILESLAVADGTVISELLDNLGLSKEIVMHHLERETLHLGADLHALTPKFITVMDSIDGLMDAFLNPSIARNEVPMFMFGFRRGELVYITDKIPTTVDTFIAN